MVGWLRECLLCVERKKKRDERREKVEDEKNETMKMTWEGVRRRSKSEEARMSKIS